MVNVGTGETEAAMKQAHTAGVVEFSSWSGLREIRRCKLWWCEQDLLSRRRWGQLRGDGLTGMGRCEGANGFLDREA